MYRTLLVDDHACARRECAALSVWNGHWGFRLTDEADGGRNALEILRRQSFDLVLTAVQMPEMDGLELLRAIKKEQLCSCVVLMSACAKFSYVRGGLVSGAFDYLLKPVDEKKLTALFERAAGYLGKEATVDAHATPDAVEKHTKAGTKRICAELAAGRETAVIYTGGCFKSCTISAMANYSRQSPKAIGSCTPCSTACGKPALGCGIITKVVRSSACCTRHSRIFRPILLCGSRLSARWQMPSTG